MTPIEPLRLAIVCCDAGRRSAAEAVHLGADTTGAWPAAITDTAGLLDALLAAFDTPPAWPAGQALHALRFEASVWSAGEANAAALPGPGDCGMLCTGAWWQRVGLTEMALDLAAAARPADWLLRIEDRLLEHAAADPGPYAALAWWPGTLASEV